MKKNILLFVSLFALSGTALAHPGHGMESGFAAGLLHPLTGWDHLLVMLALGIWAARRPAAQGWQLPVLFVSVMACAAWLAVDWLPAALAEQLVTASVLVMGALLVSHVSLPRLLQLVVVSVAAAAHGNLHGVELSHQWPVLAGMVVATAGLHAGGWWLGAHAHPRWQQATRWLGGVMLGLGAYSLML